MNNIEEVTDRELAVHSEAEKHPSPDQIVQMAADVRKDILTAEVAAPQLQDLSEELQAIRRALHSRLSALGVSCDDFPTVPPSAAEGIDEPEPEEDAAPGGTETRQTLPGILGTVWNSAASAFPIIC